MFTDLQGEAYAAIVISHSEAAEHIETQRVRSRGFSRWLGLRFYAERGRSPSSEGMSSALKTIEAKAHYDGARHEVFLRSASRVRYLGLARNACHLQFVTMAMNMKRALVLMRAP